MEEILLFCPTRGHRELRATLIDSFVGSNPQKTTLLLIYDDDQPEIGFEAIPKPNVRYQMVKKGRRCGIVGPMNLARIDGEYATYAMIGDDLEFRDAGWEQKILTARKDSLVVFADQNPTLTGKGNHCFFDARIVRALGFVAPQGLQHLFVDDYYQLLGRALDSLAYVDAGFWHNHPALLRRDWEPVTAAVNRPEIYAQDKDELRRWLAMDMPEALKKIREVIKW